MIKARWNFDVYKEPNSKRLLTMCATNVKTGYRLYSDIHRTRASALKQLLALIEDYKDRS